MKNRKRKLLPYEKVLFGLKVLMACVGSFFLILYCVYNSSWAITAAWMCVCVAQIANSCIRWEERKKWNIIGICTFSAFFVLFAFLLVRRVL